MQIYHKIPLEEKFNIDEFLSRNIDIIVPDYDVTYKPYNTKRIDLNNLSVETPHHKRDILSIFIYKLSF